MTGKFHKKLILLLLVLFPFVLYAQQKRKVDIEQADVMQFDEKIIANAHRLLGNVIIHHNNVRMWCDSAYSYTNVNMVDAFGKVHIIKDDTLHLYANFVKYNGDTRWALARGDVRLVNKSVVLTTDTLKFDMNRNIGYYDYYGTVKDSANTLYSKIGEYYTNLDKAIFKTEVKAVTPSYTLVSDTLIYNPQTGVASIVGPTTIYDEKDTLDATSGFYHTKTGYAELYERPVIRTEEQHVVADSIFYNKTSGDGLALGNASVHDFKNKIIVRGNHLVYNDIQKNALVTDSAHFLFYSEKDTLFLHADTLKMIPDTIPDEKQLLAYFRVKFFREDLQGKCDSLVYWSKDSTIQLFHAPVVWSGANQMSSEYMEVITKDKENQFIEMKRSAFIISQEDSVRFNQIKGRNMTGFIRRNDLYKIDVDGNGQSLYYARDDNGLIGLNKAESSNIRISLKESKVNKIAFITSPDGQLLPIPDLMDEDKTLPGFIWLDDIRPKSVYDIFIKEK
ncbi:OstA-like protein [Gaoshiqia sp. Z1-71]|uniref:OstA-like protein n=1 Tax=Gaoshiqia hydrogeniformans TaxID=3290090 RepID=UPI003BF851DA